MNVKALACSLLAGLFLISCDSDTSGLGGTLVPSGDNIQVYADSCFATSRTIQAPDSLLAKTTMCNIGQYTDPLYGSVFHADYLTQVNCVENYNLPDSVYGIGSFKFPDWFTAKMAGVEPYYANLRFYYDSFFGDSTNTITVDVYPIDKDIDVYRRYYPNMDPTEFYDETSAPIASMTLSAENFLDSDSLRNDATYYYPSASIRLPDSIAFKILDAYYSADGRKYFKDASAFMENLCKGFYLRCSHGDGTVLYIYKTVLEVNFKCIDPEKPNEVSSLMAEFSGNNEVMQMNSFKWTGLDSQLAETGNTWIRSPFGLTTEITIPIDELKKADGVILNSAQITFSSMVTPSQRFKPTAPPRLALIRKDLAEAFFNENSNIDNKESFSATFTNKTGVYTYTNIAPLIEAAYEQRAEWLEEHGMQSDAAGIAAYAAARPDWDKVLLIPITPKKDANGSIIGYILDLNMHQVKLIGGTTGSKIKIKTVCSKL